MKFLQTDYFAVLISNASGCPDEYECSMATFFQKNIIALS
jgi:hypothetical protein